MVVWISEEKYAQTITSMLSETTEEILNQQDLGNMHAVRILLFLTTCGQLMESAFVCAVLMVTVTPYD